jgi:hypothetical protein
MSDWAQYAMHGDWFRQIFQGPLAEAFDVKTICHASVGLSGLMTTWPPSATPTSRAARLVTVPLAVNIQRVPRAPSKRVEPTRALPEFTSCGSPAVSRAVLH